MTLRWKARHFDPGSVAYDGERLVGQVARYDIAEPGRTEVTGRFYVGFVHGERVTERCHTIEDAQRGVEKAVLPSASA